MRVASLLGGEVAPWSGQVPPAASPGGVDTPPRPGEFETATSLSFWSSKIMPRVRQHGAYEVPARACDARAQLMLTMKIMML